MAIAAVRKPAPTTAKTAQLPARVSAQNTSQSGSKKTNSSPARAQLAPPVVRLSTHVSPSAVSNFPEAVRRVVTSPGPGNELPAQVQQTIEKSLQVSLSPVRVHSDARANAAVDGMGARAFTHGVHIFLGSNESSADGALMMHEAAHVIQQQAGPTLQAKLAGTSSKTLEIEADSASAAAGRGESFAVAGRTAGPAIQCQEQAPSLWDRGTKWLSETAGSVIEFGESVGWSLLNRFAPELVPIIRQGPLEWLKERVSTALETVFNSLMAPVRSITGVGRRLTGQFAPLIAWLQDAAVKISKNDCRPLREAAEKIEQTATRLIQPIVENLQPVITKIQTFFSGLWDKFGSPIWNWIKKIAAQQWTMIEGLASLIWDKTAKIRDAAGKVWGWLKNKLGIGEGPEGHNGILQWIQAKLGAAWEWLKVKLEPYKKELAVIAGVVGGIALLLSPAGPVVVVGGLVVGVIQAVRWIKANWGKGVVQARTFVEKTLIPGLLGAASKLAAKVTAVAASINGTLGSFAAGLGRMVGAAASSALRFAVAAAQWLADQVNEVAVWAREKLTELAKWLKNALDRLQVFARQVMDFLAVVGRVAADVYAIQGKILKKLWDLIPACIRDPIVDFLIPLIIRQIELFQELVSDNEAWQKTKKDVMNILRLVFEDHDLKGAMKAVFALVLRVFNIPPELLVTIKQKAISAWDIVVKKPLAFIKNLVRSIGHGFSLLWKNLKGHVIYGLERWLLGPLADKGIQAPSSWTDPKAVFGFVLDVMGLSVNHVFELLEKRFDPAAIKKIRSVFGKVKAAWEWVTNAIDTSKSPAENTKGLIDKAKGFAGTVFTGIAEWIVEKVGTELAAYAAAAAASAGVSAILDAFRRIYRALVTAKRWMRQILDMVNQALDDVLSVANGAIETVGEKFEKLMHRGMPMVISFLGGQVGLGELPSKIRAVVEGLRVKVDNAILWLIDKIKAGIEALIAGVKSAGKALLKWWKAEEPIPATDGQKHRIYLDGNENGSKVMVASSPMDTSAAIEAMKQAKAEPQQIKSAEAFKKTIDDAVIVLVAQNKKLGTDATPGNKAAKDDVISAQHTIMRAAMRGMAELLGETVFGQVKPEDLENTRIIPPSGAGKAETIEAAPLSAKRNMGTPPTASWPAWDAIVSEGLTTNSPNYVRLHLINENFGGRGDYTLNLVPGSKQNNGDHLRTAENQLKDLIGLAPGDTKKLAQVWYKADVSYRADGEAVWKNAKHNKIKTSDFAKSIRFTWGFYKHVKGKEWKKDNKKIGDFTLGPIPLPDL